MARKTCPKCRGHGTVYDGQGVLRRCRKCNGKGWIER